MRSTGTLEVEHRRSDDGELLGWILADGDDLSARDRLGRTVWVGTDWLAAEEALDARGLRFLGEPCRLRLDDGRWMRVRIVEVSPDGIRLSRDDWGMAEVTEREFTLPFPAPADRLEVPDV